MIDDFNMSMPGEPQIGLPGRNQFLERQIQESGISENTLGGWIAAGVSVVGSIFGGKKSSDAARDQAEAQNDAARRQLEYDKELYHMNIDKIHADRDYALQTTEINARNEGRLAEWQDASNLQKYNYDMMIRNREQTSLNQQYLKSDDLYRKQITMNALTEKAGRADEMRKLAEIKAEAAFEFQDMQIKRIQEEGKLRAMGVSGRSIAKAYQASEADLGAKLAMMDESLAGAQRSSRAILEEMSRDKTSEDLAAYASKMLAPGTLPTPIVPFQTPIADYLAPREISPFDYGPEPVLGAMMSPSAAANQAWGAAISGIAGTAGGIASGLAAAGKFSDVNLKENIEQIGVSPSGLNIYEWNYIGESTANRYQGVIAQDLLSKGRHDAVVEMDNGYLGVYYNKIDVNMTLV